jgi:4-amino-4-deoxychorismate lyase
MKWNFEQEEWIKFFERISRGENARIRITYDAFEKKTEIFPLTERNFKTFKLVSANFSYSLKSANRKPFEKLKKKYENYDELILVKNFLITDTTISNLAFFDGKNWITPKYPLLEGTKLKEMEKKIPLKRENVRPSDLPYFSKIAMINAVLGFKVIEDFDIIV